MKLSAPDFDHRRNGQKSKIPQGKPSITENVQNLKGPNRTKEIK